MSTLKKAIALVLVVALSVSAGVSGTLAYLADTDEQVNVMTTGDVSIQQIELQRAEGVAYNASASVADNSLVPFEQGQPLYPAYGKTDDAYTAMQAEADCFKWNDYVTADSSVEAGTNAWNGLWNDTNLVGALDKFVFVENTGSSDCYYRTILAFECPEGMEYSEGADKEFMMNVNLNRRFSWSQVGYVTINGTRYLVEVATYTAVLPAGTISRPSLLQVVMTGNVTNEQVALLGDTYEILALSQACQTINFPDAATALNTSFGAVNEENVKTWLAAMSNTTFVESEKDLESAIEEAKDGDYIMLSEDVTISGYEATEKLIIDKAITLDLGGNTLTTECGWGGIDAKGGCTIKNGTINHTGNTAAIKAFQVESIENVTIKMTETAGKTKTAIAVQNGGHVGNISNVTINAPATQGIEVLEGADVDYIDNVNVSANTALIIKAGNVDKIVNSTFNGSGYGVHMVLKGEYHVGLTLENCDVTGTTAAIYAHDETGISNTTNCSLTLTYDAATELNGGLTWNFEDECKSVVKLNAPSTN